MIIFLNFAPFEFGGGAERWMLDVSKHINKTESVTLINVKSKISQLYGRLVLGQPFSKRINVAQSKKIIHIDIFSFIPFTAKWRNIRNTFKNARLIYVRFELLESLILIYFGGFFALKKTIAGIHSPLIYAKPASALDHLHNFVYSSFLCKWLLSKMKKIHIVRSQDKKLFLNKFKITDFTLIPNFIDIVSGHSTIPKAVKNDNLQIAFVGELNHRKGADMLISIIKKSPDNLFFHIAGAGPLKNQIESLSSMPNVKYYGYLERQSLRKLYKNCDVLFAPSRAEVFSLVSLEAMSHGLPLISSAQTDYDLPKYMQKINYKGTIDGYIGIFRSALQDKIAGKRDLDRAVIKKYIADTFSENKILPQLQIQLFEII